MTTRPRTVTRVKRIGPTLIVAVIGSSIGKATRTVVRSLTNTFIKTSMRPTSRTMRTWPAATSRTVAVIPRGTCLPARTNVNMPVRLTRTTTEE